MKNITLSLLAFLIISCSSSKNTNIIIEDKNDPINVLVFVNNLSGQKISESVTNDLLSLNCFKNKKNIVFHTENIADINFKYGVELIINKISIAEYKQTPKINTKSSYIHEETQVYNKDGSVDIREVNYPVSSTLIEHKYIKNCYVSAELNLFNLKNGKLLYNEPLSSSNSFNKIYIESIGDSSLLNRHRSDNMVNTSGAVTTPQINHNTVGLLPSNIVIIDDAVIKLKKDLSKFISKI
ncbi:hypothetical protein [uncultured Flavobacterium sp.]|uniref:hypothetical protein n=1 Tax=uncultured Flavobacterium sp. TaxID=165435 RepID=UPI0030C7E720